MDEAGVEDRPVGVVQPSPDETAPDAAAAVDADAPEVEFEPDVPLVAEVNRGASESSDRKRLLLFGEPLRRPLRGVARGDPPVAPPLTRV